jgi:predicted transcriptional regulator
MNLEFFSNDRYKILQCMFERQVEINGQNVVPLSQQNIADVVQISKKKVNTIIGELKSNGYVQQQSSTRGKYLLTNKAIQVVRKIQKEEVLF